jgi:O-antigen ligase
MIKANKKQKSLTKLICEYAFYVFLISIPFEHLPIGGINITFSQIVGVGLLCAAIFQPRICFRKPPLALIIFGVYLIVYLTFAFLREAQFFRMAITAFITMSQLLVLFWILHNLMLDDEKRKKAILVLGTSCVLLSLLMILGIGTEEIQGRLWIFGQNPNSVAGTVAIGFLCLMGHVYGRFEKCSAITRIFILIGIGIVLMALLKTGSRGGLVALTVGVLAFLLKGKSLGTKIKITAIVCLGLVIILWVTFTNEAMRIRFEETVLEGSLSGREEILPVAFEMFQERPLLGWGPVNHIYELGSRLGLSTRDPHNLYLWLLNEGGIVGALPFFIGFLLCGLSAWNARKGKSGVIPMAFIMVILVIDLKGTYHYGKIFWFIMAYATASAYANNFNKIDKFLPKTKVIRAKRNQNRTSQIV